MKKKIIAVISFVFILIFITQCFFVSTATNAAAQNNKNWIKASSTDAILKYNNKESFILVISAPGDSYKSGTNTIFNSWMNNNKQKIYNVENEVPAFVWKFFTDDTLFTPTVVFINGKTQSQSVVVYNGCDNSGAYKELNNGFENFIGEKNVSKNITSLSVENMPEKILYKVGEKFNPDGLILKAVYSDNTEKLIFSDISYYGFNSEKEGTKTITAKYMNSSVTFNVIVSNTQTYSVNVKYKQTEARKNFERINELRGPGSELIYDYELEKMAMQRAAEIVVYYSHTRPDNTSPLNELNVNCEGENIAAGYLTEEEAYIAFENSPGHKRNMINASYTGVACACVEYNGFNYWVQMFDNPVLSEEKTEAFDGNKNMNISILDVNVDVKEISINSERMVIEDNKAHTLPSAYAIINVLTDTFDGQVDANLISTAKVSAINNWGSLNTNIVRIENGKVVPVNAGETEIFVSFGNATRSIPVTVKKEKTPEETTTKVSTTEETTKPVTQPTETTKITETTKTTETSVISTVQPTGSTVSPSEINVNSIPRIYVSNGGTVKYYALVRVSAKATDVSPEYHLVAYKVDGTYQTGQSLGKPFYEGTPSKIEFSENKLKNDTTYVFRLSDAHGNFAVNNNKIIEETLTVKVERSFISRLFSLIKILFGKDIIYDFKI